MLTIEEHRLKEVNQLKENQKQVRKVKGEENKNLENKIALINTLNENEIKKWKLEIDEIKNMNLRKDKEIDWLKIEIENMTTLILIFFATIPLCVTGSIVNIIGIIIAHMLH